MSWNHFRNFFTPKNALLSGANSPNLNSLELFHRTMPPTVAWWFTSMICILFVMTLWILPLCSWCTFMASHDNSLKWNENYSLTFPGYACSLKSNVEIDAMFQPHDDIIKWKHFQWYWPFVRGIHWSPVNSPQKGQWRGALMYPLICAWIHGGVNNCEAGDLRCHHIDYDVMGKKLASCTSTLQI